MEDSQLPENLTGASAVLRYVAPHSAANGKGRQRVREQFALGVAVSNYDGVALRIYSSVLSAFEMAPRAGLPRPSNFNYLRRPTGLKALFVLKRYFVALTNPGA